MKKALFYAWLYLFLPLWAALAAFAEESLVESLRKSRMTIPELAYLREEAQKIGVRIYLGGGSAAALAVATHEKADLSYRSVFRRHQDMDIVIDGSELQAQELQTKLENRYPYRIGDGEKSVWEVTLLRSPMGAKLAKVDNPDLLNQNNDSLSLSLIELTDPPEGEPLVRDLRRFKEPAKEFLEDVSKGQIHFHRHPSHQDTAFFKQGRNPELLSAIRFVQKAEQYGLTISEEDRREIKAIVREFKKKDLDHPYVKNWLEHNAPKLILNSRDLARTRQELEATGLRPLLIDHGGNAATEKSLAWWLSKEPLPAAPVGQGEGKTAAELKLPEWVKHYTISDDAYESLAFRPYPYANALVSRKQAAGERAAYGEGFYTTTSERSAYRNTYEIPFRLKPEAREGTDFSVHHQGDEMIVLVKNRNALETAKVDPDPFGSLTLRQALGMFEQEDSAVTLGKFRRHQARFNQEFEAMPDKEKNQVVKFVKVRLKAYHASHQAEQFGLQAVLALPATSRYEPLKKVFAAGDAEIELLKLQSPGWYAEEKALAMLSAGPHPISPEFVLKQLLPLPHVKNPMALVEKNFLHRNQRSMQLLEDITPALLKNPNVVENDLRRLFTLLHIVHAPDGKLEERAAEKLTYRLLTHPKMPNRFELGFNYLSDALKAVGGKGMKLEMRGYMKLAADPEAALSEAGRRLIGAVLTQKDGPQIQKWAQPLLASPTLAENFPELLDLLYEPGVAGYAGEVPYDFLDRHVFSHSHWRQQFSVKAALRACRDSSPARCYEATWRKKISGNIDGYLNAWKPTQPSRPTHWRFENGRLVADPPPGATKTQVFQDSRDPATFHCQYQFGNLMYKDSTRLQFNISIGVGR